MAMKKLLVLILLVAAFVGGYCAGQRPGAPDIATLARQTYAKASQASGTAAGLVDSVSRQVAKEGQKPAPTVTASVGICPLDQWGPNGPRR